MKKYIAPSVKVVIIKNTELLADSIGIASAPVEGEAALGRGRRGAYIEDDFAEDFE